MKSKLVAKKLKEIQPYYWRNRDQIKAECSHVHTTIINLPFEKTVDEIPVSDLVVCFYGAWCFMAFKYIKFSA